MKNFVVTFVIFSLLKTRLVCSFPEGNILGNEQSGSSSSEAPKSSEDDLLVTVSQGEMQGRLLTTTSGFQYKSFQGIPYVKAPVGDLRFKNPEPPTNWSGVLDATKLGNACVQFDPLFEEKFYGVEDCLYLNVYVPFNTSSSKDINQYPVMLWIHGGGFILGSGDPNVFGPDKLVEQNVIVVTFNYRLGALGFLCLHTPDVPGNVGLKDQVMALKWVKNNIEHFGGNSNKITVFGESAGAGSTNYHMLSPLSKGTFQQAIIQSGSSLCPWALQNNPVDIALTLAGVLGLQTTDKQKAMEFLKDKPVNDLIMASVAPVFRGSIRLKFSPVVEKEFPNQESFMTVSPETLMSSGTFTKVPTLVGVTANEGIIFTTLAFQNVDNAQSIANGSIPDLAAFIPDSIVSQDQTKNKAIEDKIKQFYFQSNNKTLNENFFDLISDYGFIKDITHTANLLAKFAPPCYFYEFSYKGSVNIADVLLHLKYGKAGHSDELAYLFDISLRDVNKLPLNEDDKFVSKSMVQLWTNFAKYGNPTPDDSKSNLPTWEKLNPEKPNCLSIDKEIKMISNPYTKNIAFWDELEMHK